MVKLATGRIHDLKNNHVGIQNDIQSDEKFMILDYFEISATHSHRVSVGGFCADGYKNFLSIFEVGVKKEKK